MMEFFRKLFSADGFMPHGHGYLWKPGVLWLHILSDALTALAYFSISLTLFFFIRRRQRLEFKWIFLCLGIFIIACGTTHLMEILVIWHPVYWLSGLVKAVTAIASVLTAFLLVRMVPEALRLPSPASLKELNVALQNEIVERKRAEAEVREINASLERRVLERTEQLEAVRAANAVEINERKIVVETLKHQADELNRSNDDLQQFAYSASHDLQEPLRAISGCLQLLERRCRGQLDERGVELIGHSVAGAKRMQILIEGLLAFSKITSRGAMLKPLDCNGPLAYALENLEASLRETGAVVTHESMPVINGDEPQVTALLQNLIANAIKFRGKEPLKIHVKGVTAGNEVIVSVSDNGIGIAPQHFERIFVLFQRLNNRDAYPGNGIGLALCKKIVERHGGRISVSSVPGEGSVFECSFPAPPEKI